MMIDTEDLFQIPSTLALEEIYTDDLLYSDAVWLTTHNAFANVEDGWLIYSQQSMNIEHMFSKGVRSFMIDVHEYNDGLYLCHGSCEKTTAQKVGHPHAFEKLLLNIYKLLNDDQKSIITLHLECYASSSSVAKAIEDTNLSNSLLKSKNPNDQSLTLGEMRNNNERLVIFSDYAHDKNIYNGIFPTTNYKETKFSIEDYNKCEMRRDFRAHPNDKNVHLFVLNHFPTISIGKDYDSINKYSSIMKRAILCQSSNLFPNFIAVDFFEKGECSDCSSTKAVVLMLNLMNPTLKNISYNLPTTLSNELPIHSYFSSFYELCLLSETINLITLLAIDYLIYEYEQVAHNSIELIRGIRADAHKTMLHTSLRGILPVSLHILSEAGALYNAYNINSFVFTTTASILTYSLPIVYGIDNNNIFKPIMDKRGWIIFSTYSAYWTYQILPTVISHYKTEDEQNI